MDRSTSPTHPLPSATRFDRLSLFLAFVITLLWGAAYIGFAEVPLCDEPGHVDAATQLVSAASEWPELPHPPGYHLFVVTLSRGHPDYPSARATSVLFSLAGLAAFAGVWRRLHDRHPGVPTLAFALLPILQPFTAMAYTDATALALLLCAWWAQLNGRDFIAAAFIILGCLVRQTTLVWAGFFVAWEALREVQRFPEAPLWRTALVGIRARARWHVLVVTCSALAVVYVGRLTPGTDHGNQPIPNIAALHFGTLLLMLLALPVWLGPGLFDALRSMLGRWSPLFVAGLGAVLVAILSLTFANPHPWNNALWWGVRSGHPYVLLRNWPLMEIAANGWLRVLSSIVAILAAAGLAITFHRQRYRPALWLTLPFATLLLATNFLVDPRYYITPAAVILTLCDFERAAWSKLAAWFGAICGLHAPFILAGRSLW